MERREGAILKDEDEDEDADGWTESQAAPTKLGKLKSQATPNLHPCS